MVEPTALEELFTAFNTKVTATEAEIEAWNAIDPIEEDDLVTKVGLFGWDLTDFLADCADTEECDATDYEAFTGWAIGVNWTEGPNVERRGVIFEDTLLNVEVYWYGGSENFVHSAVEDGVTVDTPRETTVPE